MSETDGTCEYVLDPDDPETWGGEGGDECYVDESVLNEDGVWTCPHEAEEGEDLCIFHQPVEEKDDAEVVDAFLDILVSSGHNEQKMDYSFIGSRFGEFELNPGQIGNSISNHVYLCHSRFKKIIFDEVKLRFPLFMRSVACSGPVSFRNTSFAESSSFVHSEFNSGLICRGAEFKKLADFSQSIVQSPVIFRETKFEAGIDLSHAEFIDNTELEDGLRRIDFRESNINGGLDFRYVENEIAGHFKNTSIKGGEVFEDTEVPIVSGTDFTGSTHKHSLSFSGATIQGEAFFRNIDSSSGVYFRDIEIERYTVDSGIEDIDVEVDPRAGCKIDCNGAHIKSIDFARANVEGFCEIEGAIIEETAEFGGASIGAGSFEGTQFDGYTHFFNSNFEGNVNFNAKFNSDIDFSQMCVDGIATFNETDLSGADLRDVKLSGANLRKANCTDAELSQASLEEANLERSIFNRADLFGTKLNGSAFYGAVFGDAQINEETEFGDRCVYDHEYEGEPAAEIDDDDTGRLTKAAGQYRIIEQLARTNAFPDMVSHNFIRRQDIHREQHGQEGRWGRWLRATASKYVLEYGENPWRLIATGIITVVTFGLLYPLVGGLQPTGGSTITLSRTIDNPILLLQSIYYSTLTFTTLGMGDFLPVGLGQVLTTIETSLGAIIIALLVFVFGRRAAR